jgi:pimeloyl-ACP methyl ester carboxylesterase
VVVVSGFGTGSGGNSAWELPTTALGYAPADVVRFSYAGGRAPDPAAPAEPSSVGLAGIDQREFTGGDSQQDITLSADRLAALIAEVSAREPGVPIDVIAHSQGGVVSRLALDRSSREGRVPSVQTLVTLGSPHGGTPPADIVDGLGASRPGRALLEAAMEMDSFEGLDPSAPAVGQLGESAEVLRSVADRPLPDGVRFTSISARWDITVPAGRTADDAAHQVVIDPTGPLDALDAHGSLTTSPEAVREVGLAIAGRAPTCEALVDVVVDRMVSAGIAQSERGMAAVADLVAIADGGLAGSGLGP